MAKRRALLNNRFPHDRIASGSLRPREMANPARYHCPYCGKVFATTDGLAQHQTERHHPDKRSQSGAEKGYPVSEPLVIVGKGMAAARLVDELTRCALGRHATR
jgi:hypothetical protein